MVRYENGEVRERLNRAVSKTVEPSRVPWVRIPPSPPAIHKSSPYIKIIPMVRFLTFLFVTGPLLLASGLPELFTAVRNGDYAQVSKLLRTGTDVNAPDSDGTTALMHSVIESDAKMMKLLIASGANINAGNALDSTALMYAATNLAKAKLLLDAGANVRVKGKRGATPMSVAVTTFGSTPVLRLLTAKGAEPEDRLMVAAAQKGDLEAIR